MGTTPRRSTVAWALRSRLRSPATAISRIPLIGVPLACRVATACTAPLKYLLSERRVSRRWAGITLKKTPPKFLASGEYAGRIWRYAPST